MSFIVAFKDRKWSLLSSIDKMVKSEFLTLINRMKIHFAYADIDNIEMG